MRKYKVFYAALACALGMLFFVAPAYATIEGDQSSLTEEELALSFQEGLIEVEEDEPVAPASARSSSRVTTYAGETRVETAVMEARAAFPEGAKVAVVAEYSAWADALSATSLAGALGAPILYTYGSSVPDAVLSVLGDLGVERVVLLGSPDIVGEGAVAGLEAASISVERVYGPDRYSTQLEVFDYGVQRGLWSSEWAVVAGGENFPDALSISPFAVSRRAPVFLAGPGGDLRADQEAALAKHSFSRVILTGSETVVSERTEGFMRGVISGSGSTDCALERLWGDNRYATSRAVAEYLVSNQGFSWNGAAVTSGLAPYDALAGSLLQGKANAVLLLVEGYSESGLSTVSKDCISSHVSELRTLKIFGSKAAVPMLAQMEIADILGFSYSELAGFKVYVDAGHGYNDTNNGGYDPGACANGYQEASLTKELAGMVANILERDYGVDVFLNDDGGWYKLRHAEAVANNCDAIVSIHFNSGGGTGCESLVHSYNANWYSDTWRDVVHPAMVSSTGLKDRGKKYQEVAILGGPLPATLLEIGFIDSSYDMDMYQNRKVDIAYAIARSIAS